MFLETTPEIVVDHNLEILTQDQESSKRKSRHLVLTSTLVLLRKIVRLTKIRPLSNLV
jgi:hypothetical protein